MINKVSFVKRNKKKQDERETLPDDRLAQTSFCTLGTSEEARTEDDGVCVSESRKAEFCETF